MNLKESLEIALIIQIKGNLHIKQEQLLMQAACRSWFHQDVSTVLLYFLVAYINKHVLHGRHRQPSVVLHKRLSRLYRYCAKTLIVGCVGVSVPTLILKQLATDIGIRLSLGEIIVILI